MIYTSSERAAFVDHYAASRVAKAGRWPVRHRRGSEELKEIRRNYQIRFEEQRIA
jgi:hypothetical protein